MFPAYAIETPDGLRVYSDAVEWGRHWDHMRRTSDSWRVATTEVGDSLVSTVFLGINHQFQGGDVPPLWYETMVFDGPLDGEKWRYTTRTEAEAGHAEVVRQLAAANGV